MSGLFALVGVQQASAASFFSIQNLDSGLCLQPSEPDTTSIGVQLAQEPCDGTTKQHWTAVPLGGGKYQFANQATGGCMDAHGPYIPGTPVDTWFCGTISNQKWSLSTSVPTSVPTKMIIGGQCLDVPSGSPAPGTRIRIATCIAGHRAQAWFVH
jgi:hypothetical protein